MSDLTPRQLESVAQKLRDCGTDVAGDLSARLLTGGRSNLTYVLADDVSRWVLRRPPMAGGTPSAHDVAREMTVTRALSTTDVPVATPLVLVEDDETISAPYAIVEFVEGTTLRDRGDVSALSPALLGSSIIHLLDALVRLHRVDHVAVGLEHFGRPSAYGARQVRRWAGQWEIVGCDATGRADELVEHLRDRIPDQPHTSIVHGDYRIDNTLVDLTDGGRVAAIVDWELATIGDPVADVATMCAYRHPALDLVLGFPCAWTSPALPDIDELAAGYERAGGARLDNWEFHLALAYYKLAVISAGIDHRYRAGGTVGDGFDTAADAVGQFLDAGLTVMEG